MGFYMPERAVSQSSSAIDVVDIKTIDASETMRSEILTRLHTYWQGKGRAGGIPARSEIMPTEIPTLLPWVILVDIRRDPDELVYRLVGNTVIRIIGRELRGTRVQDLPIARASAFCDAYALTARDGVPRRIDAILHRDEERPLKIERLVMPLSKSGQEPDMLFIAADHTRIL